MDLFLVRIQENTDEKKLRVWTLHAVIGPYQQTSFYMIGTSITKQLDIIRGIFRTLPNIYDRPFLAK